MISRIPGYDDDHVPHLIEDDALVAEVHATIRALEAIAKLNARACRAAAKLAAAPVVRRRFAAPQLARFHQPGLGRIIAE